MFFLEVEASFEAAHRLENYNGPCRRVHGHHWVVRSMYRVAKLGANGMAIDLVILKKLLRSVLSKYDHQSLNSVMTNTPTAENLSGSIFHALKGVEFGVSLHQVMVEETPGCRVTFTGV